MQQGCAAGRVSEVWFSREREPQGGQSGGQSAAGMLLALHICGTRLPALHIFSTWLPALHCVVELQNHLLLPRLPPTSLPSLVPIDTVLFQLELQTVTGRI